MQALDALLIVQKSRHRRVLAVDPVQWNLTTTYRSEAGLVKISVPSTYGLHRLVPYRVAEDVLGLVGMARAGMGLVQTYDFMVQDLVQRGELVEVLLAHRGAGRPFSLVYPRAGRRSHAVRAFVEFVLAER